MLNNPKHEAFAQAVASGKSAAAAYLAIYKCSDATAETNGPKLARDAQVILRIEELRKKLEAKAEAKFDLTREKWLAMFLENAKAGQEIGEIAASNGALRELGKAMPGWYAPEEVKSDTKLEIVIRKL